MSPGTSIPTCPRPEGRNCSDGTGRRPRRLAEFLFTPLAAVIIVLAAACAGLGQPSGPAGTPVPTSTPTPTPTPTPPPDPRALLARASQQLQVQRNLEFTLEHPVGSTPLATGLMLVAAEGVADLPDRFRLSLDMEASGTVVKLDVIVVGEQAYMTNLFTGDWEPVSKEQIPFRFDFVTESVVALLAGVEDPALLGQSDLEGSPSYHIAGVGPTNTLVRLIPGALPDSTVPVEVWLDRADGRLRQVRLTGPLVAGDLPDTVRVVRLEALEETPEIAEPEVAPAGQ